MTGGALFFTGAHKLAAKPIANRFGADPDGLITPQANWAANASMVPTAPSDCPDCLSFPCLYCCGRRMKNLARAPLSASMTGRCSIWTWPAFLR